MSDVDETNPPEVSTAAPESTSTDVQSVAEPVKSPPILPEVAAPPPPIVVFQSVTARDMAGPRRRTRGSLTGASFSLGTGTFAFVGAPEDGTIALVDVLMGTRAPVRGRVLVGGASPDRSPNVRARMGSLSPEPVLPAARTVTDVVTTALRARGQTAARPSEVLSSLGLEHLAARNPRSLSFSETRALELALALSTPSPVLLVLHEPLVDVAINLLGVMRDRIRHLAESGACVVLTTSSPADARALADEVFVLHRGTVTRELSPTASLPLGSPLLVAWVRPDQQQEELAPIRRLARALAERPEISSVAWYGSGNSSDRAAELRLSGTDLDACALALADAATEVGAVIDAITPASPGLNRLRAAADAADALRRAGTDPRAASSNVSASGGGGGGR